MLEGLLIYDCNLDINSFVRMLNDTTECYKYYWLDSIMQLLAKNNDLLTFEKIIYGMIADSWYSVSKCNLRLGPKNSNGESANSIERAVRKIERLNMIGDNDTRDIIIDKLDESSDYIKEEISQISKNVPYRLLSSFLPLGGNDPLWDSKKRLISYMEAFNKKGMLPYKIGNERGFKRTVNINDEWRKFLLQNIITIRAWIKVKKIEYLQARNPGIPEIINKVDFSINQTRNLQKVRKLWSAVSDIIPMYDYFSEKLLSQEEYEIDHFIPYTHVSHNELWDLMPLEKNLNSQKNNKLPQWDAIKTFVNNQFILNQCIYKYPKIKELFDDCKSNHLKAIWAQEKLYIYGISETSFKNMLMNQLKPLYDSAYNQGYAIWILK